MSLDSFESVDVGENTDEYSKDLLYKYGLEACKAASQLDNSDISERTVRSYKPQVRQIISHLKETNPDPTDVVKIIAEVDKKGSTKNIMVVAMKKYYEQIGEHNRGEELHNLAKNGGIAEIDFNRETEVEEWITKEEIERIEEHILPPSGTRWHEIDGPTDSYVITLEHKALVMTLFYTGARVGEICKRDTDDTALEVADLYPESDQIKLYRLKKKGAGYKRDMKVEPQKLWGILDEYMREYGINEGPLFSFVKRTAQNRITDIDGAYKFIFGDFEHMDKLTPHQLRHGRVIDLANHAELEDAGQYVEHSSTQITNAYRHLTSEQQREILPEKTDEVQNEQELMTELMEQLGTDDPEEVIEFVKSASN